MSIRATGAIFSRELKSWMVTPLFYVWCSSFLLLSAFFFFSLLLQFNGVLRQAAVVPETTTSLNEWVITPLFGTLQIVLVFLVPLMTMRLVAEERRTGTFALLKTSPVSASAIIGGKYLALLAVMSAVILLSGVFPFSLVVYSNPEVGPILTGMLGLVLFAAAFGALGLFISALCSSQTLAGIISLVIFLVLYLIDTPAERIGGTLADVLAYLTPTSHTETFEHGVIDGRDVMYFLSAIFCGVFLAVRSLELDRLK